MLPRAQPAEIGPGVGVVGIDGQGGLVAGDGRVGIARAVGGVALVVKRLGAQAVRARRGRGAGEEFPGAREAAIDKRLATAYGLADARHCIETVHVIRSAVAQPGGSLGHPFLQHLA